MGKQQLDKHGPAVQALSAGGTPAARLARLRESMAARHAVASKRRKLYACLALLVISGAGVQIYMRRALAAMHNYSYFVFQSGAIAYLPIVTAVTAFKLCFTKVGTLSTAPHATISHP